MSSVQHDTFFGLAREFESKLPSQWPKPLRKAPGFFQFSLKEENSRLNAALIAVGEDGATQAFRERYFTMLDGATSFDFTPDNWIWRAWSFAMNMTYIPIEKLAAEQDADPWIEKPSVEIHYKVVQPDMLKVIAFLKDQRRIFIDGETQPVGDMSTMEKEAQRIVKDYDFMIDALQVRLKDDQIIEDIRASLNRADGVGGLYPLADRVDLLIKERDSARKLLIEIWETTSSDTTRGLIYHAVKSGEL